MLTVHVSYPINSGGTKQEVQLSQKYHATLYVM